MTEKQIVTAMKRAKGLGGGHSGVPHWLHQRVTAVAALPLMVWLVYSVMKLKGANHAEFTDWLSQPLNAGLMILLILCLFYHAALGLQVVYEDYIHTPCLRLAKIVGMKLFFIALGAACIFSILKVAL